MGAKNSLVDSVPNEVNGIAVNVEDVIFKWWGIKLSKLMQYGERNKRDLTTRGETGLEGSVER